MDPYAQCQIITLPAKKFGIGFLGMGTFWGWRGDEIVGLYLDEFFLTGPYIKMQFLEFLNAEKLLKIRVFLIRLCYDD